LDALVDDIRAGRRGPQDPPEGGDAAGGEADAGSTDAGAAQAAEAGAPAGDAAPEGGAAEGGATETGQGGAVATAVGGDHPSGDGGVQEEPQTVPLPTFIEQRRRAQGYRDKLIAAGFNPDTGEPVRKPGPQEGAGDGQPEGDPLTRFMADPEAFIKGLNSGAGGDLQREIASLRADVSEQVARGKYPDFEEVAQVFAEAAAENPELAKAGQAHRNPAEFVYQVGNRIRTDRFLAEFGGDPAKAKAHWMQEGRKAATADGTPPATQGGEGGDGGGADVPPTTESLSDVTSRETTATGSATWKPKPLREIVGR
jgi:hypothetical protein